MPRAVDDTWLAALFITDATGGPVEFTHARMQAPKPLLWRSDYLWTHCARTLCASMFDVCTVAPLIILCLAEEVESRFFSEHITVDTPVARLCVGDDTGGCPDSEIQQSTSAIGEQPEIITYWTRPADEGSSSRQLFDVLAARGLLIEPFQRAETGLREVYADLFHQ